MENLDSFVKWITGPDGGAFILVSWAVSWGLQGTGWWEALDSKVKGLIVLGVAILIGVLAQVLANSPSVVSVIEPYFRVIMGAVAAWLVTQTAHKVNPSNK